MVSFTLHDFTPTGYAESTVDLIEALQLDQPDILGWSLGGFIALTIAAEYPDMVSHVVLADTSSGGLGEPMPCAWHPHNLLCNPQWCAGDVDWGS